MFNDIYEIAIKYIFFLLQNKWSVDTSKWQTLVIAGIFMGVNSFKIYNFIEIIWIGLQKKKQKDTKVIFFMDFKIDLKFDISANTKKKRKWKLFNLVRKLALRIVFRSTELRKIGQAKFVLFDKIYFW